MPNGRKPEDLSSLAGRVASAKRSATERRQIDGPKYLKYVKVLIFLFVALFAVMLGFTYRSYSSSGDINFTQPPASVLFDIYVTNPHITVSLNLTISGNDATVDLTANAPQTVRSGTIILVSTIPDTLHEAKRIHMDDGVSPTVYVSRASFRIPNKAGGKAFQSPAAYLFDNYNVSDIVVQTKDKLFVQMPEVEQYRSVNGPAPQDNSLPALLSERDPNTGQLIGYMYNPILSINLPSQLNIADSFTFLDNAITKLSEYHSARGVPDELFWPPEITTTEKIDGLGRELRNDQIDSVVPDGTIQQDGYSWQSNDSLAPYLTATDPNAVAKESTWDFRSGIAFGIAVRAGVAFVQELPDAIHPIQRRRDRRLRV